MATQSKSKLRSILDYNDQNPLLDEVKNAISSMLDQFEQEQTRCFTLGLERLATGIANLLPIYIKKSCQGIDNAKNKGNGARPDEVIHMEEADVQGAIDKLTSQQNLNLQGLCDKQGLEKNCSAGTLGQYPADHLSRNKRKRASNILESATCAQDQGQEQDLIGEDQMIVFDGPSEGISQVHIPIDQISLGTIHHTVVKDTGNGSARVSTDQFVPAFQDGCNSKVYEELHNRNEDINGRKDDCLFALQGHDIHKAIINKSHPEPCNRVQVQAFTDEHIQCLLNGGPKGDNKDQHNVNQVCLLDVKSKGNTFDAAEISVGDACACVSNDQIDIAIQGYNRSQMNHDNNGINDNCLFTATNIDCNKQRTHENTSGNHHEFQVNCTQQYDFNISKRNSSSTTYEPVIQKEAVKVPSDNIKSSYGPNVMALYNWAPSFDLGIDDDKPPDTHCQPNANCQTKGPTDTELHSVMEAATSVHNVQNCFVSSQSNHGVRDVIVVKEVGVNVIHIKSQDHVDTTPPQMGVSAMNAINLDSPDVFIPSRERFDQRCISMCKQTEKIYNNENSFVVGGIGCSYASHGKTHIEHTPVNILQPLDVNIMNSMGRRGNSSSTCEMPPHGKRRQVRGSRYTCDPYTSVRNRSIVSSLDVAYYQAVISIATGEYSGCKAISVKPDGKTFVKYSCLGYSLKPEGKIDNFLVNCFCRLLFEENHPTKSKKHLFFNTIGQQLLKPELDFRFADVKHEFEIAHKVKSLQSCELIFFPVLHEDHWFLFIVDIKDQKFVFLDSAIRGRSYTDTMRMNLISNFTTSFFSTVKRTSINPLDFDFDDISPHRQNFKKDSGVFVMKYMDLWDPRVALEAQFTIDDIPNIRIQLLNRMLRSKHNLADLSLVQSLVGKIIQN